MNIKERLACFHSHLNAQQVAEISPNNGLLSPALQSYLDSPRTSPLYPLIEADMEWCESHKDNHIISYEDSHYPPLLKELPQAPCLFFARGDITLLGHPSFAIVGSRKPSPIGIENAHDFSCGLTQYGICIVSGLAYGIDAAAHQACLAHKGRTIAVIGTGIDIVYPRAHLKLAQHIAREGLIVSIFSRKSPPLPAHFPLRNTIISGVSLGVLVVEAGLRSGALITARLAAEQGREVFAVPGSIQSLTSRGCHKLIQEGAKLVENNKDILNELFPLYKSYKEKVTSPSLSPNTQEILALLSHHPMHLDQIFAITKMNIQDIKVALVELEMHTLIGQENGLYSRKSALL